MRVTLLLFASNEKILNSSIRLERQAKSLNIFDDICIIEPQSYPKEFILFLNENSEFFKNNIRGFGYWIWKPFLVDWMLNYKLTSNDILVYLDSGCEISKFGKNEFYKYLNLAKLNDGVFFNTKFKEGSWTKMDLIKICDAYDLVDSKQIQATFFFMKNTQNIRSLVSEWLSLAKKDNYHYIDDTDSIINNLPGFVEHRHDQSILSLLVKKNNFSIIDCDFLFYSRLYYKNSYLLKYPIHAIRNLSNESRLDGLIQQSSIKNIISIRSYFKLKSIKMLIKFKEFLKLKAKL